jgi:cation transport ATPase
MKGQHRAMPFLLHLRDKYRVRVNITVMQRNMNTMRATETNEVALIPQFGVASAFGIGGLAVCIPFGVVLWYFCNMAGWGDGATGSAISNPTLTAFLLVLPLALYFVLGIAAAVSTRRGVRNTLSLIATILITIISLLLFFVILSRFPITILGWLVIVFFFSICWRRLARQQSKEAEQVTDGDAEESV